MEENKRKIYKKMKCCKKGGKCKISWTMMSADVIFKELLRSSQSHAGRGVSFGVALGQPNPIVC